MEMSNVRMNHVAVERSPGRKVKSSSPKPARHEAAAFSDADMPDYENITVTTDTNHQPPSDMPPPPPSIPPPAEVRPREQKHIPWLFLPMAICFLTWIILLTLIMLNDKKMTEKLEKMNSTFYDTINEAIRRINITRSSRG